MIFGTRHSCAQASFENITHETNIIKRASKVKYLGIQLDPLLNFDEHVDYIKKKTIGKVKLLGRLNQILTRETLLMLYKTLILPIIDYGDVIYDCISQKNVMILQRVQNMAFKSILKVPRLTSTALIHDELDMLTLGNRRRLHMAKQMFRIRHGHCPKNVTSKFVSRSSIHSRSTRAISTGNFNIPKYRLQQTKRNIVYRGTKVWEEIPAQFKSIEDEGTFVDNVKQWLLAGDNEVT